MTTKITLEITVWDDDEYPAVHEALQEVTTELEEAGCDVRWDTSGTLTVEDSGGDPSSNDGGYGGGSYFQHAMGKD